MTASIRTAAIIGVLFWLLMTIVGGSIFYGAMQANVVGFPSLGAALSYIGWPLVFLLINIFMYSQKHISRWTFWLFMFFQTIFGLYSVFTLGGGV